MISFGQNLESKRRAAITSVISAIGVARQKYITTAPGQEMIYMAKEAEAKAWVALPSPPATMDEFPFLRAETDRSGETVQELADTILQLAALWRIVGANLEQIRLHYSGRLSRAVSLTEINTALADFKEEMSVLGHTS